MSDRVTNLRFEEIALDLIDFDPKQPRQTKSHEDIGRLANSISEDGLKQPPKVKPNPKCPGRYIVVMGETRIKAVKLLGWKKMPALIQEGEQDTYIDSVVENCCRVDLNPIDEAEAFRKLRLDYGFTLEKLSRLTGKSSVTIKDRLLLLELAPEVQEMVREGKLPNLGTLKLPQFRRSRHAHQILIAKQIIEGSLPPDFVLLENKSLSSAETLLRKPIPTDPQLLLARLIRFAGQVSAFIPVIKGFANLKPVERQKAINSFRYKGTRQRLNTVLTELLGALITLEEASADDDERIIEGGGREIKRFASERGKAASAPDTPRALPKKQPLPPQSIPTLVTRPIPSSSPRKTPRKIQDADNAELVMRFLRDVLFVRRGRGREPSVNLTRTHVKAVLSSVPDAGRREQFTHYAFKFFGMYWGAPVIQDPRTQEFILFVANTRADWGSPRSFDGFMQIIAREARRDPDSIDLGKLLSSPPPQAASA